MSSNKEITGVWKFKDVDALEDFFLKKAAREEKLGRILTEQEVAELLLELRKVGEVDGILVEGNKDDIKAVITEHFDCKVIKKREDQNNV